MTTRAVVQIQFSLLVFLCLTLSFKSRAGSLDTRVISEASSCSLCGQEASLLKAPLDTRQLQEFGFFKVGRLNGSNDPLPVNPNNKFTKAIFRCAGKEGSGTCNVIKNSCYVLTSAHLIFEASQMNAFSGRAPKGESKILELMPGYKDPDGKSPSPNSSEVNVNFFMATEPACFKEIDPGTKKNKCAQASRLAYVNPACDIALLDFKTKTGSCPFDSANGLTLPNRSDLEKLAQKLEENSIPRVLSAAGFATVESGGKSTQDMALDATIAQSFSVSPDYKPGSVNSFCYSVSIQDSTTPGMSGGPYLLGNIHEKPNEMPDTIFAVHQTSEGKTNSGTLMTLELSEMIRKVMENKPIPQARQEVNEMIAESRSKDGKQKFINTSNPEQRPKPKPNLQEI